MRLVTFQTKAGTIHIGALRADDHEIVRFIEIQVAHAARPSLIRF